MRKYIYKLSLLTLLCSIFISCEKEEITTYLAGNDAVRFPAKELENSEPAGYNDQTDYFVASLTFIESPFVLDTVYNLPIVLVGNTSDQDRQVSFEIDTENSSAPEGSYDILDAVIPANKFMGYIQFRFYNVEELNEETYALYLKLKPTERLSVGPSKYINAYVSWNNSIPAPVNSQFVRTYNMLINSSLNFVSTSIANYSPRALQTIVTALGWIDWDDYSKHGAYYNSPSYGSYKYLPRYAVIYNGNLYKSYALKVAEYINDYNAAHPDAPLVHDAGGLKGQRIQARTY